MKMVDLADDGEGSSERKMELRSVVAP